MTVTNENPFEGYEPPAAADAIKLEGVGDWITLKVAEVSEPFEAEYGLVFVISGEVLGSGGPTVQAPAKGSDGGYLIAFEKDGKEPHVREETTKAIKAAGRRSGAILEGDVIAWKRDEDVTHSKSGKKFANAFRHHVVRVISLADEGPSAELPF